MNLPVLPSILLVISTVHAFQYTELAQYIDSHQEEYVEVRYILLQQHFCRILRVQEMPLEKSPL